MDGEMLEEKGKTLTRVAKDVLNANFSCNVSNPVSSEISPPVQQNCYKPSKYKWYNFIFTTKDVLLTIDEKLCITCACADVHGFSADCGLKKENRI